MKHVWKSKEKTDADVEEGLYENENIKREYVIQVVRETKYKWWSVIAIYILVMFLFGLSYYMLRTYSFSETMSVICQRYLPMSESQFESQKSHPSNEALEISTESLTVDKLKLLENENDLPLYTEALAKSIAQSSSEVKSDNTVQKVFDPLLLSLLDDSEIQRLKENSMEDLTSVFKLFSEFENNSNKDELFPLLHVDKMADANGHSLTKNDNLMPEDLTSTSKLVSEFENNSNKDELFPLLHVDKMADVNRHSLTKNDNMMPEDLTSVSNLFLEFENDSNKNEFFPLLNVNKMADADAQILTKSENMMPADDVEDLKTVSSLEDLKADETHYEKSSVESGVVNCPPDKSDEFSTEFSSSESAQLEEKDNTELDHFKWFNIPSEYFFIISMPYFWNSDEQASQLAYIRDSVKDIKQTTSNIKLSYGSNCKIIITKGVVDATLCPGFSESGAESNLESSASPQPTTTLFSPQTNTILSSIQTSTMLPSTQTTTTTTYITTEEDHDDYNDYYYDSKDDFLCNPFMKMSNQKCLYSYV